MIRYQPMYLQAAEPSSPSLGVIWIKPLGSSTYQTYIWLNEWSPIVSGGTFITETDADTHYINVITQDTAPDSIIKPGWIWINTTTLEAYLYIFDYLPLTGS